MTIPIKFRRGLKANLPSTATAGEPLFTEDTHEMFMGTGDGIVPVSDHALKMRVDKLEQSRSTVSHTFTEDFILAPRVDVDKTTALLSTGKIRTSKLAYHVDDFSSKDYFDSDNSFGVNMDTTAKKVTLNTGTDKGAFVSTVITTEDTDRVTLSTNVVNRSGLGLLKTEKVTDDQSKAFYYPQTLVDRSGRDWTVSFVSGVGIHAEIRGEGGSVVFSGIVFTFPYTYVNTYHTHSIAVDYNNRVWVTVLNNSSAARVLYVGAINPNGTVYMSLTNYYQGAGIFLPACSTVVDPNGRVWIGCAVTTGFSKYLVLEPDGSTYVPITSLGNSSTNSHFKFLYYAKSNIMVAVISMGSNLYMVKLNLDGAVLGAIANTINSAALTHSNMDAFIDESSDRLCTCAVTASALVTYRTNIDTPATSTYSSVVGTFTSARGHVSFYKDGALVRVVYAHPLTTKLTYLAVSITGWSKVEPDSSIQDGLRAYFSKDSRGKLLISYDSGGRGTNPQVERATIDVVPTAVVMSVTNDNGITWFNAPEGVEVEFPTAGKYIRIRAVLSTPNPTLTPDFNGYTLVIGNNVGSLTQEFVSTKLPSVHPIGFATLTADQVLGVGGYINWFVSNNGGGDWVQVELGNQVSFPNPVNSDLRVKAVITSPSSMSGTPFITGYTLVSSNIILNPDIADPMLPRRVVDLEINLLKTNFKLITYMNAPKYGLKNMVIDTFTDLSGVDIAKSQAVYDHEQKKFTTGIVDIVPLMTANNAPAPFVAAADLVTYGAAFMLFDRSTATYWGSTSNDPHWISIDLGGAEQTIDRYLLSGMSKYAPTSWLLQGSNNGSTWETLHSVSGYVWTNYENNEFTIPISNIKPYKYYRIYVTASQYGLGVTQISELRLQRAVDQNFLQSKPEITTTPPSKIVIVGDEVVAGGKIEYHASRDGGNTWTVVPAETLTDISSQPVGTELVVKATIHGNAELNAWVYYYE
ncbi:discoidin domain-containing protein [Brevibacillus reuszeri]|uniref:galactose-binding domain-containing protein n=1 Tax=Brevibacillus reuszeri TaxID=54915 RepID=UPI003D1D7085